MQVEFHRTSAQTTFNSWFRWPLKSSFRSCAIAQLKLNVHQFSQDLESQLQGLQLENEMLQVQNRMLKLANIAHKRVPDGDDEQV